MLKKIKKIIESTILCIRFPFLFPRNRFTNLHYNNWRINEWLRKLYTKYSRLEKTEEYKKEDEKRYYYHSTGDFNCYWTSIWAYPAYHIVNWYCKNIQQLFHCVPYYTELDRMPVGWRKAFGIDMCQEIKQTLLKKGGRKLLREYRIMDIKEKYGELRWYSNWTFEELEDIIEKYSNRSLSTCIECGEKAVWMTDWRDWASPYCDKCIPEYKRERAGINS